MKNNLQVTTHDFLIYRDDDNNVKVNVLLINKDIWLTQDSIEELFGVTRSTIIDHINNILNSGELKEETSVGISDENTGGRKQKLYNLDMIIAVGYRVNSKKATNFRIWATKVLKEYLTTGVIMDENRLKHSLAVARKMVEIGKKYILDYNELEDLFVLGLNHDIGYEYGNNSDHEHIGGEILKRNKYKYWKEVYYHGNINTEYSSLYLKILNKADMQIDRYGNDVGYIKRLEDIKNRYGENSMIYKNAEILVSKLRSED